MGQDDSNSDYEQLAFYIASDYFLDHPSKDVRLLVACCIADVFRIFAPEAPYNNPEHVKEIFLFLTRQLRGLEDPEAPSFKRYFYLLEVMQDISRGNWLAGRGFWGIGVSAFKGYRAVTGG